MSRKEPITDPQNIELRSEELREILRRPPSWLVRWGIAVFFLIVLILLVVAWFLKYPDLVRSSIVITTQNPPAFIVPRASGPLEALFVKDRQAVQHGEMLAVIENPADYSEVLALKEILSGIQPRFDGQLVSDSIFAGITRVGELQTDFASFLKSITDLKHFRNLGFHTRKVESLRNEAFQHERHLSILKRQRSLLISERRLVYRQFQRDSSLLRSGVISQSDFEKINTDLLKKDQDLEQSRYNISAVEITISQLEQSMLQLELDYENSLNQLILSYNETHETLMGKISSWEQQYILKATASGTVGFSETWSPAQQVREGVIVFVIVPEEEGEIIGRLALPVLRSGKVKPGQKVLVRLSSYPHMEFGMLTGEVISKSLVPTQDQYVVEISFPGGMVTNYGIELTFSQEMSGNADIITEDLRLIQRILNPIRSAINRNRTI